MSNKVSPLNKVVGKRGKTLGETLISTGIFVLLIVIAVFVMRYFKFDASIIIIAAVFLLGVIFTIRTVRTNPKNKADVKDEHETCIPILDRYAEKKDVKRLMRDYKAWWEGEHSNYTRMHFAAKVIDILEKRGKYETALKVLYQVAELPLKGRDHYDYDNYLRKMEPVLKEGLEKQQSGTK